MLSDGRQEYVGLSTTFGGTLLPYQLDPPLHPPAGSSVEDDLAITNGLDAFHKCNFVVEDFSIWLSV